MKAIKLVLVLVTISIFFMGCQSSSTGNELAECQKKVAELNQINANINSANDVIMFELLNDIKKLKAQK